MLCSLNGILIERKDGAALMESHHVKRKMIQLPPEFTVISIEPLMALSTLGPEH